MTHDLANPRIIGENSDMTQALTPGFTKGFMQALYDHCVLQAAKYRIETAGRPTESISVTFNGDRMAQKINAEISKDAAAWCERNGVKPNGFLAAEDVPSHVRPLLEAELARVDQDIEDFFVTGSIQNEPWLRTVGNEGRKRLDVGT